MSNGRRKSRKPQKWEEFESGQEGSHPPGQELNPDPNSPLREQLVQRSTVPPPTTVDMKSSSRSEGEMTVLDVLQGLRQGFLSECTLCSLQMKDWQSTIDHIRSHRSSYVPGCCSKPSHRGISCNMCLQTFSEPGQLVTHAHSDHPSVPASPFLCPFCGKQFGSCGEAQQHFDIKCVHMKCPVCSAVYDQEYKLYSHLAICLPDFHPHLKSLVCHVCSSPVAMSSLADHMISHSAYFPMVEAPNKSKRERDDGEDAEEEVELPPPGQEVFLCEVCDKRFDVFESFRCHLYDHSDSLKFCPLCMLKGFTKMGLVVRHLILRCPKRTRRQLSLASLISAIAKKEGVFFLDVICCLRHDRTLLEALRTWTNVEIVSDFLKSFVAASDAELDSLCRRSHLSSCSTTPSPSDVELLAWLSQYELQLQRGELSLAPDASKDMASWIPPKNVSKAEYDAMLSTFYKSINESKASGFPTTLTLNNAMLNAEVKITALPPGESEYILESYKDEKPRSLPSVEFIRKNYPGVVLLPEVDLETLRKVANEAEKEKRRDWVNENIRAGYVTKEHLQRLEMEAQHLRELEPFYMVSKPSIEFSALRDSNKILEDEPHDPDPLLIESLMEQAEDLMKHVDYFHEDS